MRISNLEMTNTGLKKGIKYIVCCGLVTTMLSLPLSSLAEKIKSNMRFQAKNVQTSEWDMEPNCFPMGVVLHTADYMEKPYVNYMNSSIIDEIGQDDLIVVCETDCARLEEDNFYFKTRYRVWFRDIKVTDFEDMETIARVEIALNKLFSGLEVDEAIEIVSVEDIVIKSNEPLEPNEACGKRWIESIDSMDYEDESDLEEEPISDLPKDESTSKRNIMVSGGFGAAAAIGIVALGRNIRSGHDGNSKSGHGSNIKNIKRYFKRRKDKQTLHKRCQRAG